MRWEARPYDYLDPRHNLFSIVTIQISMKEANPFITYFLHARTFRDSFYRDSTVNCNNEVSYLEMDHITIATRGYT